MCCRYRTLQIEQHVHPGAPRSTPGRQQRPARTGADAPAASPIVAALSASSSATFSGPRSAADPTMPGSNGRISCEARYSINPFCCGGKPCPHVFRQGEQGAYRHEREITIRLHPTSRLFEIRRFLRDPAISAVAKNHADPANPPTRPACADLKLLTVERMCCVQDPY